MVVENSIPAPTHKQLSADYDYLHNSLPFLNVRDVADLITPSTGRGPKALGPRADYQVPSPHPNGEL